MKITAHKFGGGAKAAKAIKDMDEKALVAFLGGKGAHLQVMTGLGVPVPPGLTIPTSYCVGFMEEQNPEAREIMLEAATDEAMRGIQWLQEVFGYRPLVSIRSGAPVSMPGMMDTILNVGMNDEVLAEWAERLTPWAAADSYRRLMQMLGCTAKGIDHDEFDALMVAARKADKVELDKDITLATLASVVDQYRKVWEKNAEAFPQDVRAQVKMSIAAVWGSWNNSRAVAYRDQHGLDHAMGTAVTVQAMVFGNMNDQSGSGVLFTRNPNTGEKGIFAEYLSNAQGEDVVAGIRTPDKLILDFEEEADVECAWQVELSQIAMKLETHYRDVQDIEFTVQDGKLFLLQTRSAKRSAIAAVTIAHALLSEGMIDEKTMLSRITGTQFMTARRPVLDYSSVGEPLGEGLPACPGVGIGHVATTAAQAVEMASKGLSVILVTKETTPDDIHGMIAAKGILTSTGGATSHAAVVARALDKPCIVGMSSMQVPGDGAVRFSVNGSNKIVSDGDKISLDGLSGKVFQGEAQVISSTGNPAMVALERLILDRDGTLHRGDGVSGIFQTGGLLSGYVVASSWVSDPTPLASKFLGVLKDQEVGNLYLDLSLPKVTSESDELVSRMAGKGFHAVRETRMQKSILSVLLGNPGALKGVTLLNVAALSEEDRIKLRDAGVRFSGEARTVSDVMSGDEVIITDEFISTVIGGAKTWDALKGLIGEIKAFSQPKTATVEEAAFRILG